jgi:hypothetical protein
MDVQFSIRNSYPPEGNIVVSVPRHGRCQPEQRTHDMRIEVITNGHVNLLLHVCPERRRDLGNRVCSNPSLKCRT